MVSWIYPYLHMLVVCSFINIAHLTRIWWWLHRRCFYPPVEREDARLRKTTNDVSCVEYPLVRHSAEFRTVPQSDELKYGHQDLNSAKDAFWPPCSLSRVTSPLPCLLLVFTNSLVLVIQKQSCYSDSDSLLSVIKVCSLYYVCATVHQCHLSYWYTLKQPPSCQYFVNSLWAEVLSPATVLQYNLQQHRLSMPFPFVQPLSKIHVT